MAYLRRAPPAKCRSSKVCTSLPCAVYLSTSLFTTYWSPSLSLVSPKSLVLQSAGGHVGLREQARVTAGPAVLPLRATVQRQPGVQHLHGQQRRVQGARVPVEQLHLDRPRVCGGACLRWFARGCACLHVFAANTRTHRRPTSRCTPLRRSTPQTASGSARCG